MTREALSEVRGQLNMTRRALKSQMDSTRRQLGPELRNFVTKVSQALEAFEQGDRIDEHLIVNGSSLTAYIARWNLLRDILPIVEEEP